MKSIVETNFKNMNLNLVQTLCQTPGGQSLCSSQIRRTQDQFDGFGGLFFDSSHPSTPFHPADLPSAPEPHGSHPSRRGDHRHPGSSRTVAMPFLSPTRRWHRSRPASPSAAPCLSQHHTAPPGRGNRSPPTPTPMPEHAVRRPNALQAVPHLALAHNGPNMYLDQNKKLPKS